MSFSPRNIPTDRPWQQGGEEAVSFGSWLRRQREVREISLREIADASKISLRYLEAFEQDRFDALPAPIFARGFLREYAKYVGLDPDEVVNHFLSAQQALEPDEDGEQEAESAASRSNWILNLLLVLAVLTVIVLVALLAFYAERSRGAGGAAGEGAASPPAAAPVENGPPPPAEAATPLTAFVGTAGEGAGAAGGEGAGEEEAAAAAPLTVALEFAGDCWVEIDVDGRRRLQQKMAAGQSLTVEAQDRVRLTLGNAGEVAVRVNGRPYELGYRPGDVARGVVIDLETARRLAEGT